MPKVGAAWLTVQAKPGLLDLWALSHLEKAFQCRVSDAGQSSCTWDQGLPVGGALQIWPGLPAAAAASPVEAQQGSPASETQPIFLASPADF